MALAHSTMSLFGFLATTALGISLTFLVKKKIGTYITAFGIVGSLGMGVIKLIDHLCCKKRQSPETTHFIDDGIDPDPKTVMPGEDDDFSSPELLTEAKLLGSSSDNLFTESSYDLSQPHITHRPGILERMSSILRQRNPPISVQQTGQAR